MTRGRADVVIQWIPLSTDPYAPYPDPAWGLSGCLYAYLDPSGRETLYIGKAWGVTLGGRWDSEDKRLGFWRDLERERGIWAHATIAGLIVPGPSGNVRYVTHQLLCDLETLLIIKEQPWGNIQSRKSRGFGRPGLTIACRGPWPGQRRYVDPGPMLVRC